MVDTAAEAAREIVDQLFDRVTPPVTLEQRVAISDSCDRFVTGVLTRWMTSWKDSLPTTAPYVRSLTWLTPAERAAMLDQVRLKSLSLSERRNLVATAMLEDPSRSLRSVMKEVGCTWVMIQTVRRVLREQGTPSRPVVASGGVRFDTEEDSMIFDEFLDFVRTKYDEPKATRALITHALETLRNGN